VDLRDQAVSLERDARITTLKAEATAGYDLARVHDRSANLTAADFARERMDRALDDLLALGVGR
jgi:hypothetical protein